MIKKRFASKKKKKIEKYNFEEADGQPKAGKRRKRLGKRKKKDEGKESKSPSP